LNVAARLACILILLAWLAIDLLLGFLAVGWPGSMPPATLLVVALFAAADVAALGQVAFGRGDRLPVLAQAVLLGPALLIAGCSLVSVVG
jgi:hypothetical protein